MLLLKAIIAFCGFQLFIFETTLALPLETKHTNVLSKSVNTASSTGILKPRAGFLNGYILGSLGFLLYDMKKTKQKETEKAEVREKEKESRKNYCKQQDHWMDEPYADCLQSNDNDS